MGALQVDVERRKALCLASKIKPFNTLHRHKELKDDTLTYDNSACIVKTIIGDLFFRDDEVLANSEVEDYSEDGVADTTDKKAAKKSKEKANA